MDLQNSDGGWPTFCRGWGRLPFDKSSPDLTAHALEALHRCSKPGDGEVPGAIHRGMKYLADCRRGDGSWVPLWFGNQKTPDRQNPVLGTAWVLDRLGRIDRPVPEFSDSIAFLLKAQNPDGGWGGGPGIDSTVEETASVLATLAERRHIKGVEKALESGSEFLCGQFQGDLPPRPAPVGLYFATLWYSEKLYPVIWTVKALGRILGSASG